MDQGARFAQATDSYLTDLYAAEPVTATAMGIHTFDDQLPNYAHYALDELLRRSRAYLHQIDRLSVINMTPDERIDYRVARAGTQMAISRMEQARPLERQPGAYVETLLTG